MYRIDRDDVPAIFLVSVTVLVLGAIAATIDSVVGGTGGFDIEVDRRGGGIGRVNESLDNGSVGGQGILGQEQTLDLVICIDALRTTPAILAIVTSVGLVLYALARRYNTATSLLVGTGVIPIVWGSYFFLTNCLTANTGGWTLLTGQAVVTNEGTINSPTLPPVLVAGVIGVFVLAGLGFLATITRGTDEPPEVEPEEEVSTGAAVGRAAGRAAERIAAANVPVDNAVYRAWLEMTRHLDIENPETTPPQEFAGAAVEAGLDEDDVAELTELFTDVRYGGKGAADREDRAVAILRRIDNGSDTEPETEDSR